MSSILGMMARELMKAIARHVAKFPRWLQPLALVGSTLLACCLVIAATPLILLASLLALLGLGRTHHANIKRVKLDIRRLWSDDSPEAAVNRLREIVIILEGSQKNRVLVEPYGRLWMAAALAELEPLLYEYEVARYNWEGGLGVAEDMINLLRDRDESGYWNRAKARCLIELGRSGEAKEFLFSVRNPEKPDPEIERLLSKLQQASV